MLDFKANDWYWRFSGGSVYSSARRMDISAADVERDADYQAFLAAGGAPVQLAGDDDAARADLAATLDYYGLRMYPPTLAEVRAEVTAAANAAFEAACVALLADEPPSATATYGVQRAEAEAYTLDSAAPTPMLDMLATARGLPKAELARRVLAKAGLYAQASGLLLGRQQRLMDDAAVIMAADIADELKIAALRELVVEIGLPGLPDLPDGGEG